MDDASWLARWEIRRTWPSYPITVFAWVLGGVLAAAVLADLSGDGGSLESGAADIFLLAVCQALVANFGSRDSWVSPSTSFPERVAFFRSLPISVRQVVGSRALARLPVFVLNATALFVTPYLISAIGGGGVARLMSPVEYLWFALMWVGYALVTGSWVLFGELAIHGRTYYRVQYIGLAPLAAIVVLEFVFRPGVVATMIRLAETHGPLMAGIALLAGAAVCAFWLVATSRRLARRDLLA